MAHKVMDKDTMFSDNVDLSASPWDATGTINSSSVDLGGPDIDEFQPPEVMTKAPDAVGATATVVITLQDSADDITFADVTPVLPATGALALADFKTGVRFKIPTVGIRRYIRLEYVVGTAGFTGGRLQAALLK